MQCNNIIHIVVIMVFAMLFKQVRTASASVNYDIGLREYVLQVYRYMSLALFITAITAFMVANIPQLFYVVNSAPLSWLFALAPIGFVIYFSSRLNSMPLSSMQKCLWIFSSIMGVSLSSIFLIFKAGSIAKALFISASMFGVMNIYGHTTDKDLTGMGSFMMMGLFGIVVAALLNIFMHSSAIQFAVSFLSVLIFTGLTAYDAQKMKSLYYRYGNSEYGSKMAIMGALNLYFDFINIFLNLLYLMQDSRK